MCTGLLTILVLNLDFGIQIDTFKSSNGGDLAQTLFSWELLLQAIRPSKNRGLDRQNYIYSV